MKINKIGYNHRHEADFFVSRSEGSGDYLLLLLKTPAIFTIHGQEVHTLKNSFILYKEGTPQYYRSDGGEFANDWFHFSITEKETEIFKQLEIPLDQVIFISDLSNLSILIKSMSYEIYSSNTYRQESVELYLQLFFYKLSEKLHISQDSPISSHYDKMAMIRSQIYSMPQYDWHVEGLAHQLTMSKSHFEHTYKKIFGISIINEVITARLEHAKFMLATTDIPVNQIAEMCGYKSDIHFMRQFRSRMNMTPTEFRTDKRRTYYDI